MRIRPLTGDDIDQVAVINADAVPGVTPADAAELRRLVALAESTLVAVNENDRVLGFVIVMAPGADYESENYRWFSARGTDFLYVDRIAIAPDARGAGIGETLYRTVAERAFAQGRDDVTCEVNTKPPNPGSLRFHERLGFVRVGELVTKGGAYEVALLSRPLR